MLFAFPDAVDLLFAIALPEFSGVDDGDMNCDAIRADVRGPGSSKER